MRKKLGLALGSGGVRGLIHVGVIKTLVKHNIPIDYIAGTSIGAWVGAYYSTFLDVDKLSNATAGYKKEKFYSFFQLTFKGGFVKGKKVTKLLQKLLGNGEFADLNIPLTVVTTDLVTGLEFDIDNGPVVPAVQASMAIPVIYKPIKYQEKLLVDGGLCNPLPDDIVKKMGADVVISVNLENYINQHFDTENLSVRKTMSRSFNIARHYLSQYSIKNTDILIEPLIPLVGFSGWKKFFLDKVDKSIIKKGEEATEEIIPRLRKLLGL